MSPEQNEVNKFSSLRQQAETAVEAQPQDWSDYTPQEWQRLVHELKVHQVELELQNEELRRTQFERELAQKNYADLYDSAPVGYVTVDEDNLIIEANLTGAEMLGKNRRDLIGQRLSHFIGPEDQDAYHFYRQRLSKTDMLLRTEIKLLKADGAQFPVRLHGRRVVQPGEARVQQYRIVIGDITERVQAEQARQEAHKFVSAVLDTAGALIVVLDRQGHIVRFNRACEQLTGYSLAEVQGQPVWDLLLSEERAPVQAVFEQLRAGQFPNEFENYWVARDGSRHLITWSNTALPDAEGVVQYIIGTGIDITQRKEAEEAYRALVDRSLQGLAIFEETDQGVRLTFANPGLSRIGGYSTPELMSMEPDRLKALIHPQDQDWVWKRAGDYLAGEPVSPHFEFRFICKVGLVRWVEGYANRIEYRGKPAIQIAFIDISERKRAEETLRESEARLEGIINTATDAIITLEVGQRIILFNAAAEQMFGYSADEVIGRPLELLLPERFRERHTRYVDYFGQTGVMARSMGQPGTLYGRRADGREFPIEVMISQVEVAGRKFYTAIARDITARKQAEEEIDHSRRWLERIAQTTPDIIFVLDIIDNHNVYTNRSILEILGYSPEEFRYLPDILQRTIAPDDLLQVEAFYRNMADAKPGEVRLLIHPTLHKDGSIRWMENRVTPFTWDENGTLREVLGLARDITKRKQTELELAHLLEAVSEQREQLRALTRQLAEAQEVERKALARELHDQVGQKLTALNLNLNTLRTRLAKTLTSPEPLVAILEQSLKLVEETTEQIQNVMIDLRPPMLDDYGLLAALRWYGAEVTARVNFTVIVQGEEPEPRLVGPVEHALFRITQEALNNIVKHAQASQVTISLGEDNGTVRLVIADDGRGFDLSQPKPGKRTGWGLLTMIERAEAVGGQCQIKSHAGQGAQVIVEVSR